MNAPRWWQGLTRDQWLVFAGASLAWAFDCFDAQVFNLARDGALEQLIADPRVALEYGPYTTSVFLVAWAIGGMLFGALGDRYGRARLLTISILLYSLSTGLSSFSTGFADFCLYRFASGLGVGGVFGLAVALVADSLPDRSRAPALGLLQSLSTWGNLAAALIGMLLGSFAARGPLPLGLAHWQAMFLVGALPALLCVPLLRKLQEPPKWVAARSEGATRGIPFGSYRRLLVHPEWRKRAWLGLVVCSAGIIGLWGVGNFHPKIVGSIVDQHFAGSGLSPGELASEKAYWRSIGLLLQNVGAFFGMLALAKIAQTHGRRFAIALALLLSIVSTWIAFRYMRQLQDMYWMLPLMGFGQLSVLGALAVYLPELFPTSLRSTGTSFCYNAGRIVAATAPFTMSQLTRSLGGDIEGFRTAGTWVSLVLLIGIAVLPWLPETRNQPLPED
jgi:MFS family permease